MLFLCYKICFFEVYAVFSRQVLSVSCRFEYLLLTAGDIGVLYSKEIKEKRKVYIQFP